MSERCTEPQDTPSSQETPQQTDKSQTALTVRDLRKSFNDTNILQGVSLSLHDGERVALLGSNGSGKSTLLRSALRLIEPDSGSICIRNQEISKLGYKKLKDVRSSIGFVFQKHNLVPRLSALTNVIHGLQGKKSGLRSWFQSFAHQNDRERAIECLSRVGLAHVAGQQVQSLSGGQSQRVAIARALMQEPQMIFADEPVASLDPESGTQVMELLSTLAKKNNIALLFTTHHLEHALGYADRIIGLQGGKIVLEGPTSEFTLEGLRTFYE